MADLRPQLCSCDSQICVLGCPKTQGVRRGCKQGRNHRQWGQSDTSTLCAQHMVVFPWQSCLLRAWGSGKGPKEVTSCVPLGWSMLMAMGFLIWPNLAKFLRKQSIGTSVHPDLTFQKEALIHVPHPHSHTLSPHWALSQKPLGRATVGPRTSHFASLSLHLLTSKWGLLCTHTQACTHMGTHTHKGTSTCTHTCAWVHVHIYS